VARYALLLGFNFVPAHATGFLKKAADGPEIAHLRFLGLFFSGF